MAAVLAEIAPRAQTRDPVVVVGAGPVGVRAAQEIRRRLPDAPLIVFGAEAWQPYNRVRLSSALAGELQWSAVSADVRLPEDDLTTAQFGAEVVAIDREAGAVRDATGRVQPYSELVLATGSAPHVPGIPGIRLPGVYTFRDMNDAQRLLARRIRSRRTVVLGGGLLGLESARAMRRYHTEVWVLEHAERLMPRQLDDGAARALRNHVEAAGIRVVLGLGVVEVLGDAAVAAVKLRDGDIIPCDTVVVATGIRPNIQLALASGIAVGRGIKVDDRMRTSDPRVYAVGECAEHRGVVYGIVAPGFEQAAVAAHAIAGGAASYAGSVAATRLKVLKCPVFSMGEVGAEQPVELGREQVHTLLDGYRKVMLGRGRLIGAVAVGEWSQLSRVQEAVLAQRRIWPWQAWRFRRTGLLWPEETAQSVAHWPAAATVCNCVGVTRGALGEAMAAGCATADALAARTGASTVCGSCRPLLQDLAGCAATPAPVRGARPLTGFAVAAALLACVLAIASLPYPETADLAWRWDKLWRESFWKQVSGFALLGCMALLAALALRKRVRWLALGEFSGWRIVHVVLGVIALGVLVVHTGGRMGDALNGWLAAGVVGLTLAGAAAGAVIGREHALPAGRARKAREASLWVHILLLWPLPVLLAFHILKSYWY